MEDRFRITTFYIYFALVVVELILSCLKEKPPFFSPVNLDPVSKSVLQSLLCTSGGVRVPATYRTSS